MAPKARPRGKAKVSPSIGAHVDTAATVEQPQRPADHDVEPADDSSEAAAEIVARSTRRRVPSQKQAVLAEDRRALIEKQVQDTANKLKKLKQLAKKIPAEEDDHEGSGDDNEFESEEEDDSLVQQRKHKSSFESRGIYEAPLPASKRLRIQGASAAPARTNADVSALVPYQAPPTPSTPHAGAVPDGVRAGQDNRGQDLAVRHGPTARGRSRSRGRRECTPPVRLYPDIDGFQPPRERNHRSPERDARSREHAGRSRERNEHSRERYPVEGPPGFRARPRDPRGSSPSLRSSPHADPFEPTIARDRDRWAREHEARSGGPQGERERFQEDQPRMHQHRGQSGKDDIIPAERSRSRERSIRTYDHDGRRDQRYREHDQDVGWPRADEQRYHETSDRRGRSHSRTSATRTTSPQRRARGRARSHSVVNSNDSDVKVLQVTQNVASNLIPAPFANANGQEPTGKPKASDYEDSVKRMINHACHQYEVLLVTEDPYPPPGTAVAWAARVWAEVSRSSPYKYQLTGRIEKIITGRNSHARGALRDRLRPLIAQAYGLSEDVTDHAKQQNMGIYTFLLDRDTRDSPEARFHFAQLESRQGFAGNRIIKTVIKDHWFAGPEAPGVKYAKQFSPLREVTLALIFTTIEYCLDQWATGSIDRELAFSNTTYRAKYLHHLRYIQEWASLNPPASQAIRQRMHDRARRASGAPAEVIPPTGLSDAARERLRLDMAAQVAENSDG